MGGQLNTSSIASQSSGYQTYVSIPAFSANSANHASWAAVGLLRPTFSSAATTLPRRAAMMSGKPAGLCVLFHVQ
jgi:hypothetical protein